jgi:hypothetical protein
MKPDTMARSSWPALVALVGCSDLLGADFEDKYLRANADGGADAAPNRAPVAGTVELEVVDGTENNLEQLLGSDPDSDPLRYRFISGPERGTVTLVGDAGQFKYSSTLLQVGLDTFAYQVNDGRSDAEIPGEVRVRVLPFGPTAAAFDGFAARPNGARVGPGIDIDGDTAVAGTETGGAYVLERKEDGRWRAVQQIRPPPGTPEKNGFGWAVALDDDWAVIGAWGGILDGVTPSVPGQVYFYKRDATGQFVFVPPAFHAPGPQNPTDHVGWSVDIEGSTAVIGAPGTRLNDVETGVVYVCSLASADVRCAEQIGALDPQLFDAFGWDVSLEGNTLAVAASSDDEGGVDTGAAYVFVRGERWQQQVKLIPRGELVTGAELSAVALSGRHLLCGAHGAKNDLGIAYIYERDAAGNWLPGESVLRPASPTKRFGFRVALDEHIAVVTMYDEDFVGSGFIFRKGPQGWLEHPRTLSVSASNLLGSSAAVSGHTIGVGATFADTAYFVNVPKLGTD